MAKEYHDFAKNSKFFSTSADEEEFNKQKKFMSWIQEFSKKIVFITSLLYVAAIIFIFYMVFASHQAGMITGLDTLISEINLTFREVVGGYIIKSAVENAVKIAGNYYVGIIDAQLNAVQDSMSMPEATDDEEIIVEDSGDETL